MKFFTFLTLALFAANAFAKIEENASIETGRKRETVLAQAYPFPESMREYMESHDGIIYLPDDMLEIKLSINEDTNFSGDSVDGENYSFYILCDYHRLGIPIDPMDIIKLACQIFNLHSSIEMGRERETVLSQADTLPRSVREILEQTKNGGLDRVALRADIPIIFEEVPNLWDWELILWSIWTGLPIL